MEDTTAAPSSSATIYNVPEQQVAPVVPPRPRRSCECSTALHYVPGATFEEDETFNILVIDSHDNEKDWAARFSKYPTIQSPSGKTLKTVVYQVSSKRIFCFLLLKFQLIILPQGGMG